MTTRTFARKWATDSISRKPAITQRAIAKRASDSRSESAGCPALAILALMRTADEQCLKLDVFALGATGPGEKSRAQKACDLASHRRDACLALALTKATSLVAAMAKTIIAAGVLRAELGCERENSWDQAHRQFLADMLIEDARRVFAEAQPDLNQVIGTYWGELSIGPTRRLTGALALVGNSQKSP